MKDSPLQIRVSYAILLLGALLVLIPLYSIVAVSLQPGDVTTGGGFSWPRNPTLSHYKNVWSTANYSRLLVNSLIVGVLVVVVSVGAAVLAGYAFANLKLRGAGVLFPILLIGIAVPFEGLVLPLYFLLRNVGLTDNLLGVVAAESGLYVSFGILWMRQAFLSVPREVMDAATVDGAGSWDAFRRVAMPITWPSAATLAVLFFVWSWKEFLVALVLLQSQDSKTAPAGLSAFAGRFVSNVPDIAAAAVITSLPVVIMYLFLQRQMIRGLTQGAVEG